MAEFKKGDLTVSLTNEATAYPTLPDTGTKVTGTTRFQWFKREGVNRISQGASGRTLAGVVLDGSTYECDVSYEANSGSIPQGVKIGNNPARSTFSIQASAGQVTECPDGKYVPVGQECPEQEGECITPVFQSGGTSPPGQLAAANGTSKSLSFSATYSGFLDSGTTFKSGTATVWGATTPQETFGPTAFTSDIGTVNVSGSISGDICTVSGSFSAPFDGINTDIVKGYLATLNLIFECKGEPILASVTIGGTSVKWGEKEGEVTDPECKYGGYFSNNSTGCGSYISQVTDPDDGTVKYYAVGKVGSTDPADFVGEWTVDAPIFNCQICPSKDCPNATITRVYVSPARPKVGEQVTAFVEWNVDKKGYETISDTTAVRLGGDGIPCVTTLNGVFCERFQATGTFSVGPYTTEGIKTLTASYVNSYQDESGKCTGEFGIGLISTSKSFSFEVSNKDEPPPEDPTDPPSITASISGPQNLTLGADGKVQGTYFASGDINPNGWIPSGEGNRYQFGIQSSSYASSFVRTFNQEGQFSVKVTASRYFCSPSIDKACIAANTADLQSCTAPYCRKWVSDDAVILVNVKKQQLLIRVHQLQVHQLQVHQVPVVVHPALMEVLGTMYVAMLLLICINQSFALL